MAASLQARWRASGDERRAALSLAGGVRSQPAAAPVGTAVSQGTVQPKFDPAVVKSRTHLRARPNSGSKIGATLSSGKTVLVNPTAATPDERRPAKTWYPAVNAQPEDYGRPIPPENVGYVRPGRVGAGGKDLNQGFETMTVAILQETETLFPMLRGHLAKPEHARFLYRAALNVEIWNNDASSAAQFSSGFESVQDKILRVRQGAEYLADNIEHWRRWLHPDDRTVVWDVHLMESDLHERGLGVARVEFRKSPGPTGHPFEHDTIVQAMVKPEDKSLEEALLGASPASAASQINRIAGLAGPDEMLTTIRMKASQDHGSLVEIVKGMAAKDMAPGPQATKAVFHETLVFAFLAGLDDLHVENVFWHEGRPYLIDADNVLNNFQMLKRASGDIDQTGFWKYNADAAAENREAVKSGDNRRVRSRILDAMLTDANRRVDIAKVLRNAIIGKKGRVVPISSAYWGKQVRTYATHASHREALLDMTSHEVTIVRSPTTFDESIGAGLIGVCGENTAARMYDRAEEMAQQRADFNAGVIPFYEYDFTTGRVTHNGRHIWNGQTVDQAIGAMLDRFDPSGRSRASAGL